MKKYYLTLSLIFTATNALSMQNDPFKGVESSFVKTKVENNIRSLSNKEDSETPDMEEMDVKESTLKAFFHEDKINPSFSDFSSQKLKFIPYFNKKFLNAVKNNDINSTQKFLITANEVRDMVSRSENVKTLKHYLRQRLWIRSKTNINAQDDNGNTPLIWAIRNKNCEVVKLLLKTKEINSSLNTQDNNGNTPLIWAIRSGNYEIIKLLCQKQGLDFSLKDNQGSTVLDWVEMKGFIDILNLKNDTFLQNIEIYYYINESSKYRINRLPSLAYNYRLDMHKKYITLYQNYSDVQLTDLISPETQKIKNALNYFKSIHNVEENNTEKTNKILDETKRLVHKSIINSNISTEDLVREWLSSAKLNLFEKNLR